ncbi:ATP-dependent endonuclease, partial [Vibrio sp. 10N.222.48.A8]
IRLEAELTIDDVSPEGIVNESVYFVLSDRDDFEARDKRDLRRSDRNNIQVHYIPASRNPFREISSSTKILLGRLLDAIQWDKGPDGELQKAVEYT